MQLASVQEKKIHTKDKKYKLKEKYNHTIPDMLTLLVAGDKENELCIYTPQPERGSSSDCREAQTLL